MSFFGEVCIPARIMSFDPLGAGRCLSSESCFAIVVSLCLSFEFCFGSAFDELDLSLFSLSPLTTELGVRLSEFGLEDFFGESGSLKKESESE